jgi:signal transduction histidine kinase
MKLYFQNMNLRNKIIVVFAITILTILLSILLALPQIKKTIVDNSKKELVSTTTLAGVMIESLFDNSIQSYLRGISETHVNNINHLYSQYQTGEVSKDEAKRKMEALMLSHKIGESGYIATMDVSKGEKNITFSIHPFFQNKDANVSKSPVVQRFYKEVFLGKKAYFEYEWKNPGETDTRLKSLYGLLFEPWQWLIMASAYKSEFFSLINLDEFRKSLGKNPSFQNRR